MKREPCEAWLGADSTPAEYAAAMMLCQNSSGTCGTAPGWGCVFEGRCFEKGERSFRKAKAVLEAVAAEQDDATVRAWIVLALAAIERQNSAERFDR